MGLLVAMEGIDGTGKGTQAKHLAAALDQSGRATRVISFPRYAETQFGRRIGEFLNGRYGDLDATHPALVALLFAGDRFESRGILRDALASSDVVILDRYVASNVAHQAGRLDGDSRRALREWIEHLEFEIYELPRPDLTILLDLPATRAQELIARKQARQYTDKAADLHEADAVYLDRVRRMYLELAEHSAHWHTVSVERHGTLRAINDVAAEVSQAVATLLNR